MKKKKQGFSLIEVLVVIFIAAVVFTTFYTVAMVGSRFIIEAKNRLAAVAVANESMEIIRNLAYENVGVDGNVEIPGNLLASEEKIINGNEYKIETDVRYVDDSMDGVFPDDAIQNDYKIVRITVSWVDTAGQTQSVSSTSRFVPSGLETSVGGSPLSINVSSEINGIESPVEDSSVSITNTNPVINDSVDTDPVGHIMLPAASVATGYHLVITKNGYEQVETMDTTPTFIPMYKHVDVIANNLNQYSFKQNKLADLRIKASDYQNNPVEGIAFSIAGGKVIGHDDLANIVYRMSNTPGNEVFGLSSVSGTTAADGEKVYSQISPGSYNISMDANADYEFIDFAPSVSPVSLDPGSNLTYEIKVADKALKSLFLKITDITDGAPVVDAQVSLTDGLGTEIFSGKRSSLRGVVFYPEGEGAVNLQAGNYILRIEAVGFQTKTIDPVSINSGLLELPVALDRNP